VGALGELVLELQEQVRSALCFGCICQVFWLHLVHAKFALFKMLTILAAQINLAGSCTQAET
jgi:hypothetical protein